MVMKRKRIFKFLPLLLFAAGAMFVASCSSDDEEVILVNAVWMDEKMNSFFDNNMRNNPSFHIEHNTCIRVDSQEDLVRLYVGKDPIPEIDFTNFTLILGSKVFYDENTDAVNFRQLLIESDESFQLNLYTHHLNGNWGILGFPQILYYGLYPKLKEKEITVNLLYE